MRILRRAITTLIFSAISLVLPLRRMPAVSTKTYSVPLWVTRSSTESRVVPATGETIDRSPPVSAFSSVDLPTFGRPMIATLIAGVSGSASTKGKACGHVLQQVFHADIVFRRNREISPHSQRVKVVRQILLLARVRLVYGQRDRLAEPQQHLRQIPIGAGDLRAAIHQENDLVRLLQRELGLFQNLARNIIRIVHHDAAGVDDFEPLAIELRRAMDAVARDARLIAHDGTALTRDAVEKSGLADVRPAYDHDCGHVHLASLPLN